MRVLQLHDEPWDSGIAHYALTLSEELDRRGHEVHFWGAAGSHALGRARAAGLRTLELNRPWLCLPRLRAALRERRIEIINAHTGSAHSLAAALAWGLDVSVIRTRADARRGARHLLARILAGRTRAFIAANSRIRTELSAAFPSSRVELIAQGLPSPAAPALKPLPAEPAIGILGRLDPVKGHEILLAAARLLEKDFPQARFRAAGDGAAEAFARLRRRAAALDLDGRFEFLGRVPDAFAFIASCRVGVVASTGSEAVSRAALEWMSMGRPLVAASVGCLPDLVEEGRTGLLVAPCDPGALAAGLKRLLENPGLAEELGRRGKERFEETFGVERFGALTERLYEESLKP